PARIPASRSVVSCTLAATTYDGDSQGARRIGYARIRAAASAAETAEETPPSTVSSAGSSGRVHSPSSETSPCLRRGSPVGGLRWLPGACSAPDIATHVPGRRREVWHRPPSPGETGCAGKSEILFPAPVVSACRAGRAFLPGITA